MILVKGCCIIVEADFMTKIGLKENVSYVANIQGMTYCRVR